MAKDDIVVINQPGLEQRTSKTGRVRYTIKVRSEPVIFNLDPKQIGATVTQSIIHHLRERVRNISAQASPATIEWRKVAAKAYAAGKPWAMRRFSGGRTGATAPTESTTALNNSGRFVNSIVGNASNDGAWRVNVAANRLDARTADVQRFWNRLVELVPEFGDPRRLLESDIVRKGIDRARADMIKKAQATTTQLQISIIRSILGLGRQVADILAG
jgi:hypothetical protein